MSHAPYAKYMSSVQLYLLREVKNKTEVLLQRRKHGWGDNLWEASAAGHVDSGENPLQAVVHEALEEIGIVVNEKDIKFISVVCKNVAKTTNDVAYYNFSFYVKKWKNIPQISEPDKCYEIKWFDIKKLPRALIPDRKVSLTNLFTKTYYANFSWTKK
jgi:8-oxo-dGTP pyrophosphatase MutT (NUDIX family)